MLIWNNIVIVFVVGGAWSQVDARVTSTY